MVTWVKVKDFNADLIGLNVNRRYVFLSGCRNRQTDRRYVYLSSCTDRQTDGIYVVAQTDGQTDRQTVCLSLSVMVLIMF